MRAIFLIFFLIYSSKGSALCLPDPLVSHKILNSSAVHLEQVAGDLESTFQKVLPSSHSLSISFDALNPRVNADIVKSNSHFVINVMGGMLSHEFMNENAMKLLLCHELGHLLGGPPLKSRGGWSSTEGQADYYSGRYCSRLLEMDEDSFFNGAINLTAIYAEVTRQAIPRLDLCEERTVLRTNFGYPSVQCRLDTIIAGWNRAPRPACWFVE